MIYLTSSSFFSLCEGSIVVLLHNMVVMPEKEFHGLQSKFFIQRPEDISRMSPITNKSSCGYMKYSEEVRGSEGGSYFGSSMCLPLGIGSLVAPTRARIERGMFGLLQK